MLNRGQRIRIVDSNYPKGHPNIGDEGYICDVLYFLESRCFLVSAFFFNYPGSPSNDRCEKKFILLDPFSTLAEAKAINIIDPIINGTAQVYSPTKLTERRFGNQMFKLDLSARVRDVIEDSNPNTKSYTSHMMIRPWYGRRLLKSFDQIKLPIVVIEPVNEKAEIKSPGQLRAWINAYGPLISVSMSTVPDSLLSNTALAVFTEMQLLSDQVINLGDSMYLVRKNKIVERLLADKMKLKKVIINIRLLETLMRVRLLRHTMRAVEATLSHLELYSVYCLKSDITQLLLEGHMPNIAYEEAFVTLYLATLFSQVKTEMSQIFHFFGQHFLSRIRFTPGKISVQNAITNLWNGKNNLLYLMKKKHFKTD